MCLLFDCLSLCISSSPAKGISELAVFLDQSKSLELWYALACVRFVIAYQQCLVFSTAGVFEVFLEVLN
jgi:hypothetical protein